MDITSQQSTAAVPIVWMDIAYQIVNNKPIIHIFGRDANHNAVETIIDNFRPYFYIPSNESYIVTGGNHNGTNFEPMDYCRLDQPKTDIYGRSCTKVYTDIPSRVSSIRDYFSWTNESDILFERRVIVDLKIKYGFTNDGTNVVNPVQSNYIDPLILFIDIEVRSPKGEPVPDPQKVLWPIASIQFGNSYTGNKIIITNGIPEKLQKNHIACQSETELFEAFFQLLKRINPDVLTGWFCLGFDFPYLIRRAQVLGLNTRRFCRINDVQLDLMPNGRFHVKVPGRQCIDMLEAYKKLKGSDSQLESYKLKTISKLHGFAYEDYGAHIDELLSSKDYGTFLQYCENDITSLFNIDKQTSLFRFFESIREISGCKLEQTLYNSNIIETFLMHEGIAPMPRKFKRVGDPFPGAYVMDPPVGLHNYVGWVDLDRLYPNIMMAYDLSPDVQKLVPKVLRYIVDERERLRSFNKTPGRTDTTVYQEKVMKYLANSFYGVLGSKDFRLYDETIAAKVTEYGRTIAKIVRDYITSMGYQPIYMDTDSVSFKPVYSANELIIVQNKLNVLLKQYSKDTNALIDFTLKGDKIHSRLMFKTDRTGKKAAKKRYAGCLIWSPDYGGQCKLLNYTGIELKRSDQSKLTKDIQLQFLTIAFIDGNIDKAVHYIRTVWRSVLRGEISIYDVSIPKGVYSDRENPWIRGKYNSEKLYNHVFDPSEKIRLVYLVPREGQITEICIDEDFDLSLISGQIDWRQHAEKSVKNKMESYMTALGYSWDYVVNGQQTLVV